MENPFRAALEQPRQLLTIAVAAVAALLIGSELYALLETALTPATSTASRGERHAVEDPLAKISQAGLFGAAAAPIAASDDSVLPQSSAQLILRGVFTGSTPDQGSAIFELPDGTTRMVRAGGTLDGGMTLKRIYPGRVTLDRNGLQENLAFPSVEEYADNGAATAVPAQSDVETNTRSMPAALSEEEKRANILRRLEELRTRSLERNQG